MDNLTRMFNCPEIQDGWKLKVGDDTDKGTVIEVYFQGQDVPEGGMPLVIKQGIGKIVCGYRKKAVIFKPSIEQLMDMVQDADWILSYDSVGRIKYTITLYIGDTKEFTGDTPEEALIQAVMYELHRLKWTDNGWVEYSKDQQTDKKVKPKILGPHMFLNPFGYKRW